MTGFDLALALFVVLGAAWGLWVGALRQIVNLLAWAAAWAAPYFFAVPVARALEKPLDVPYVVSLAFSAAALSLLAYVAVRVLLWLPLRARKKQDKEDGASLIGLGDRLGGALMGATKAVLVVWALLSTLAVVATPFESHGYKLRFADSSFYRLSREHNFWGTVFRDRFAKLQDAVKRAKAKRPKSPRGALDEFLKDPRIQQIAADADLRGALEKGDVATLLRSNPVMSLVSDDAAMDRLIGAIAAAGEEAVAR